MNAEARDRMVANVQAFHAKYPHFAKVPVAKDGGNHSVAIEGDPADNTNYVLALHKLCAHAEPIGRRDGKDAVLVGKLYE